MSGPLLAPGDDQLPHARHRACGSAQAIRRPGDRRLDAFLEVLRRRAIALSPTAIIIVQKPPSGDPAPSCQGIALTRDLVEAGRHMKIAVHDHVIVGSQGRSSMKALGLF